MSQNLYTGYISVQISCACQCFGLLAQRVSSDQSHPVVQVVADIPDRTEDSLSKVPPEKNCIEEIFQTLLMLL